MPNRTTIHGSYGIRSALLAAVFLCSILFLPFKADAASALSSLAKFLSPGELARSHAREEKLQDCYACHSLTRGIDDALCLDCHKNKSNFCDKCHDYMGVKPYCWECHADNNLKWSL